MQELHNEKKKINKSSIRNRIPDMDYSHAGNYTDQN